MLHSGGHPPIGWAVSVFEVGLSQGGEYHFKSATQAFHLGTVQVPGASHASECEHILTPLLISRATNTTDFLFVSGLLLPDHGYSIPCLWVNVNRLFLIKRKFLLLPCPAPSPAAHRGCARTRCAGNGYVRPAPRRGRGGDPPGPVSLKITRETKKE